MTELQRLGTAWDVDRHIVLEGEKLLLLRLSEYENPPTTDPPHGHERTHPRQSSDHAGRSIQETGMTHYLATRQMDEVLMRLAPKVRKYCTIYAVSTVEVPEFNSMYELAHEREPFALMFFFRNAHIRVDVGTGNNNKINFVITDEDLLPIIDAAYRAGRMGKHITSSEKKFTTAAVQR